MARDGNRKRKSQNAFDQASNGSSASNTTSNNGNTTKTKKKAKSNHKKSSKLLFILSPAKTLDVSRMDAGAPLIPWTRPSCDIKKTNELVTIMKKLPAGILAKILKLSPNLAANAKKYWEEMDLVNEDADIPSNAKPCGFCFTGAAYKGLDITSLETTAVQYLQDHLRIVDPLYGWLRPLDAMQPYRLEMATQKVKGQLHEFWESSIRSSIKKEGGSNCIIINVASKEYSAAVDHKHMVDIIFRHGGRVIAVHAKRARGLFVRYCALNDVQTVEDLRGFQEEGYRYQENESDSKQLVFDRPKNWEK